MNEILAQLWVFSLEQALSVKRVGMTMESRSVGHCHVGVEMVLENPTERNLEKLDGFCRARHGFIQKLRVLGTEQTLVAASFYFVPSPLEAWWKELGQ